MMPPKRLFIPRAEWDKMLSHILTELPLEACGVLVGNGAWVEKTFLVTNAAQSPVRFRMDAQEQCTRNPDGPSWPEF